MKGLVFSEFLDFVERSMGADMVDSIIDDCDGKLSTGGAYTAVGTYPCAEMGALLGALSARSAVPTPELLRMFGENLAGVFVTAYPQYFDMTDSLFDFVSQIDTYIHVEVKKLYPDAELPSFEIAGRSQNTLSVIYRSPRALQDLAAGLFLASARHFGETVKISHTTAQSADETHFIIERVAAECRTQKRLI